MKRDHTFPKEEKLKSRKLIGEVFSKGYAVKSYPIRIQFIFHEKENFPLSQMAASVSKRNFKSAVDRNRIKRQIKEAYRINKQNFINRLEEKDKRVAIMVIYSQNKMIPFEDLEAHLIKALERIRI